MVQPFPKRQKLISLARRLSPLIRSLLFLVGLIWLLVLPSSKYSKHTYISESSLLPGQVNTYFSWGETTTVTTYRQEMEQIISKYGLESRYNYVEEQLKKLGISTARQIFFDNHNHTHINIYGIMNAPRSDGSEALVLSASWLTQDGKEWNYHAISLILSLIKYFKKYSLWSKDIIILFADGKIKGVKHFLDAYHTHKELDKNNSNYIQPLQLKSGLIQGAICIDYPGKGGFSDIQVFFEGVNGQLPNLDLINTPIHIAQHQLGIPINLHREIKSFGKNIFPKYNDYFDALSTMLSQMLYQVVNTPSGSHGVFGRYKIDAITLHMNNLNGENYGAFHAGKMIESIFRSLNNLLEHFHQSFFFYLLPSSTQYVSIGLYLPVPILVATSLVLQAIEIWDKTGDTDENIPKYLTQSRRVVFPLIILGLLYIFGFGSYLLTLHAKQLASILGIQNSFLFLIGILMIFTIMVHFSIMSAIKSRSIKSMKHSATIKTKIISIPDWILLKCFTLSIAGITISTLATINFSLAVAVCALIGVPFATFQPTSNHGILKYFTTFIKITFLFCISPIGLILISSRLLMIQPSSIFDILLRDHQVLGSWFVPFACCVYGPLILSYFIIVSSPHQKS